MRKHDVVRALLRAVRVCVALLLIGFLLWRAGIRDIASLADSLKPGWLLVAAILTPPSLMIRAYSHSLLLNRNERVIRFSGMMGLTLVGVGMNLFLPMGAADLAKAHYGYRIHGHAERMIVSSVLDKVTSLTALAVMGVVGSAFAGEPWMILVSSAVLVLSLAPFAAPRMMPWRLMLRLLAPGAEITEEQMARASRVPGRLLAVVWAVSFLGWILSYTITYVCCLAAGAQVAPAYVFALAPLATLAKLIPVSAGGIGLGEVTIAALLARVGVSVDVASQVALIQMALLVLLPGSVGVLLLARHRGTTVKRSSD